MGAGLQAVLRCEGSVDRGTYTSAGVVLVCVKFVLDTALATTFGRTWTYADYWSPGAFAIGDLPDDEGWFFAAMLALAVHFAIAGVALSVRRLRDAGLAPWLAVLFFVPFVNLVFFAVLALAPPRVREPDVAPGGGTRWLARSAWASAAAGVVLTALLGGALVLCAAQTHEHDGWVLFVGLPFCLGLLSVLVYANAGERTLSSSIGVGLLSAALACTLLMAVAAEGAIFVLIALPLALPLAALGALTGYAIQRGKRAAAVPAPAVCSCAIGVEAPQDARAAGPARCGRRSPTTLRRRSSGATSLAFPVCSQPPPMDELSPCASCRTSGR